MGVLRKAGVWLGLVEDDEDRDGAGGYDDEFGEDEGFVPARPASPGRGVPARSPQRDPRVDEREPRGLERDLPTQRERRVDREAAIRRDPARADRNRRVTEPVPTDQTSVRSLSRQPPGAPNPGSHSTRDNLALAPQVHLRDRAVVGDDQGRRYQITTLHPTTYSEARTIGELFRDGVPVIMNLTEMAEADARRLVDFAAGLAFGLRGTIDRVTNRVFLLSPANIQVTAEDRARIADGEFFDQAR